jgi:hypothetical protein
LIKKPKESRNHAGKIRGTRTPVIGNKRFKACRWHNQGPGGQVSGTREHDLGNKRFQEQHNSRDRFPEPDVMFKGTKDFILHRNQHFYPSQLVSEIV